MMEQQVIEGLLMEVESVLEQAESRQEAAEVLQSVVDKLADGSHPLLSEPTPE